MIDEMDTLRTSNEQKIFEIQRLNGQLNKALDVNSCRIAFDLSPIR